MATLCRVHTMYVGMYTEPSSVDGASWKENEKNYFDGESLVMKVILARGRCTFNCELCALQQYDRTVCIYVRVNGVDMRSMYVCVCVYAVRHGYTNMVCSISNSSVNEKGTKTTHNEAVVVALCMFAV